MDQLAPLRAMFCAGAQVVSLLLGSTGVVALYGVLVRGHLYAIPDAAYFLGGATALVFLMNRMRQT